MRVLVALHPFLHMVLSVFKLLVILIVIQYYLIVVFICNPIMNIMLSRFSDAYLPLYIFFHGAPAQIFCPL